MVSLIAAFHKHLSRDLTSNHVRRRSRRASEGRAAGAPRILPLKLVHIGVRDLQVSPILAVCTLQPVHALLRDTHDLSLTPAASFSFLKATSAASMCPTTLSLSCGALLNRASVSSTVSDRISSSSAGPSAAAPPELRVLVVRAGHRQRIRQLPVVDVCPVRPRRAPQAHAPSRTRSSTQTCSGCSAHSALSCCPSGPLCASTRRPTRSGRARAARWRGSSLVPSSTRHL